MRATAGWCWRRAIEDQAAIICRLSILEGPSNRHDDTGIERTVDSSAGCLLTIRPNLRHDSRRQEALLLAGRSVRAIALVIFSSALLCAQTPLPDVHGKTVVDQQGQPTGSARTASPPPEQGTQANPQTAATPPAAASATPSKDDSDGKQSKRILGIIPNYRAVSANTQLPPLALGGKFRLATEDSFDYSSFLVAGVVAGASQAKNSSPEFRRGVAAYGRYYWHSFADLTVGNYLTETIFPGATHEDPRYYTLGHGGFFRRTGYAVSRLLITRTDSGGTSFNFSEIVGNGAGAGISDLYYPAKERTWTKTGQKWLTQVAIDGVFNLLKEYWPDINRTIFHGRY